MQFITKNIYHVLKYIMNIFKYYYSNYSIDNYLIFYLLHDYTN